jgi:membrane-anchored glycerophosphoryl diester phosphodiesterase (GDPDase)
MEALGFGWNAVTKDFAGIALPIAVVVVIAGALGGAPAGVFNYFMTKLAAELVDAAFMQVVSLAIQSVSQFFSLAISAFFTGGIIELALKAARGQKTDFSDVFGGAKYFGPMFVGVMCAAFLSGLGLVFCIVPGLIIGAGLLLYQPLIVDQKLSAIDALKKSWEMTNGHKTALVIFLLLCGLVELAGVAACCVGALLVSTPMVTMATVYIYLKMNGEQPRLPVG